MSDCKVYRREVEWAADGGAMSADGRAHVSSCSACGEERRRREALRALVGGLGKVGAPADFEFRLRARMAAAKAGGGRGRFSGARWLYGFAPVAVAACFVVVSATLYFRQAPRPQPAPGPAVASAPPRNDQPVQTPSDNSQSQPAGPVVKGQEVARANPDSPKVNRSAHRVSARAAQTREAAAQGESRANVPSHTLDYSVTGAPVFHLNLKTSAEPLRVIMRDERGAERVVPMRSVSFGSQSVLAREAATRPSAAVEVGGVW